MFMKNYEKLTKREWIDLFYLQIIADALNQLIPEKVNIFLLSPSHEGQCTKKENWFGTQYCVLGKVAICYYWLLLVYKNLLQNISEQKCH